MNWFNKFLSSNRFFYSIIGLSIFQSLWIALTNTYPLPFDEYYHYGIINIYAHQFSPFIRHQPSDASLYGDITRTPSYLYHYLMSFPYRIIEVVTSSLTLRVILLRFINIGMVIIALFLFRKLLLKIGFSKKVANTSLLFFVLIPLISNLSATINYDNLIMVITPLTLLIAVDITQSKKFESANIFYLLILMLLGSLVKYVFLIVCIPIFVYVAAVLIRRFGKNIWQKFIESFSTLSRAKRILLILFLTLAIGLFTERVGVNLVRYHKVEPGCEKVQSISVCEHHPVYIRNKLYAAEYKPGTKDISFNEFNRKWFPKMINDSLIAFAYLRVDPLSINGPLGAIQTKEAYSIPKAAIKILFIIGLICGLLNITRFLKNKKQMFIVVTALFYVSILWLQNFSSFRTYGRIVAVQPRYMLILAPLLIATLIQSMSWTIHNQKTKIVGLIIALLIMTQGMGLSVYILRSRNTWYWPNYEVMRINWLAKEVVGPLIIVEK